MTITSKKKKSSVSIFPSEDELIVAQILLTLRHGPSLIEYLPDSNWKRKKRRSCLDSIPPFPAAPQPQSLSIQRPENKIEDTVVRVRAEPATEKGGAGDRATISPDSPFLFAPTDDEKSRKRSRKNYCDMIEQLTQQNGFLRREIQNVKKYHTKLKAYNSELRTFQQEVSGGIHVEIGLTHHQPFVANPTAQEIQFPIVAQSQPSNNGFGSVNNRAGPIGFDLNVPAEETLAFEVVDEQRSSDVNRAIADNRFRFAEARRLRKEIINAKSIKNRV